MELSEPTRRIAKRSLLEVKGKHYLAKVWTNPMGVGGFELDRHWHFYANPATGQGDPQKPRRLRFISSDDFSRTAKIYVGKTSPRCAPAPSAKVFEISLQDWERLHKTKTEKAYVAVRAKATGKDQEARTWFEKPATADEKKKCDVVEVTEWVRPDGTKYQLRNPNGLPQEFWLRFFYVPNVSMQGVGEQYLKKTYRMTQKDRQGLSGEKPFHYR